jgi:tRNA threonylcarbamoyladenosine biosynthesis protein TsaB
MNNFFVAAQATYTHLELGLFSGSQQKFFTQIEKKDASKKLIPAIESILKDHHLALPSITGCIANAGPAPFTTLRVLLSTLNGIAFAHRLKLIEVDGLKTFVAEYQDPAWPATAYLLNAFNRELYCAFEQPGQPLTISILSVDACIDYVKKISSGPWRIIGNGASLYENEFKNALGNRVFLPADTPDFCSLQALVNQALAGAGTQTKQLLPLYVKHHTYKPSIAA